MAFGVDCRTHLFRYGISFAFHQVGSGAPCTEADERRLRTQPTDVQSLANTDEDAVSGPGAARTVQSHDAREGESLKGCDGR